MKEREEAQRRQITAERVEIERQRKEIRDKEEYARNNPPPPMIT
jgi:hypothetical protein